MGKQFYNFSAGPAMMPSEVMAKWQDITTASPIAGSDITFMEIGHRTEAFQNIVQQLHSDLRELLNVPPHYHILFMPGGGRMQFATLAMNLMGENTHGADYFHTGLWSSFAITEAERFGSVHCVANANEHDFTRIPDTSEWQLREEAAYCHFVSNETAHGLRFPEVSRVFPSNFDVPVVADMTSDLLTKTINIEDYGMVYAASQKNLGTTGFTVVILREDLIGRGSHKIPSMLNYAEYLRDPTPVTPVTFAIYLALEITAWLKSKGGLSAMEKVNMRKANKLYDFIDASDAFSAPVHPDDRSNTNVLLTLCDESRTDQFLSMAESEGLVGLGGHRAVGGLRASLYNAMPEEGVDELIRFMRYFIDL